MTRKEKRAAVRQRKLELTKKYLKMLEENTEDAPDRFAAYLESKVKECPQDTQFYYTFLAELPGIIAELDDKVSQ